MDFDHIAKQLDDEKTIAEHKKIILTYLRTGFLDKADAIKKYKDFNDKHKDYYAAVCIGGTIANNLTSIENMPPQAIIGNLNQQLVFLCGKNLLEEWNNGQPATRTHLDRQGC